MKYLVDIFSTVFNFNGASYCILFTITLCINKHILSSFNFTYPTVLQGWQTATTTLIMFLLKSVDREKYKESVHAPGFTIFAPHLVFHVLQLVTGSKALSLLPVPVFLCGVNTSEAIINLVLKSDNRFINLIGASVILTSGIVLLWKYYELTKVGACVWFVAYIVVFTADSLYCGLVDMKVNRLSRLFYINLFSLQEEVDARLQPLFCCLLAVRMRCSLSAPSPLRSSIWCSSTWPPICCYLAPPPIIRSSESTPNSSWNSFETIVQTLKSGFHL
ncbi:uncharacterized protein LOC120350900 isoform X4 [Nilaparvata lugens]|uniref:uncharacterized protein LOC120350900 isoform X4 n=1 Tax=Nilaparvata lugens TaxID=108931 RepID=UPI00193CF07C|nr:uncharacterized protein LOC120350900 isoform X4 [Nilaparvata lugens]